MIYQYSIRTYIGPFNPVDAIRLGWEFNIPLIARIIPARQDGPLKSPEMIFFNINQPNVQIVTIKMAEF